MSAYRMMAEDT